MPPWQQDGSAQCDVLAGGVDESGLFKGIYISGVSLMALMRTFQLSKVFMPCDVPTPVAALGQSLQDGVPLVVVTRGCFGRQMDYGPGPVRNDVQKTIWQTARDMRAEMPQIMITCIDIPNNLPSEMLQDCMQQPLNEYRELMYQDGTWYTPSVVNAAPLGKWMNENMRSKKTTVAKGKNSREVPFNRKKFDWQDPAKHYTNMWVLSWRPVLEARQAPEVPRRTDLIFYPGAIKAEEKPIKLPPSVAEVNFKKALTKARDTGDAKAMLAATTAYLEKASLKETESLQEATKACDEAGDLFKAKSEAKEAFEAVKMKFKALVSMGKADEAMAVAKDALGAASTAAVKAQALKLVVTCHQALGDLEEAVKAASDGKADVAKLNDDEATCEALDVLVSAYLTVGDTEGAIKTATDAGAAKSKVGAKAQMLLAQALEAKGTEQTAPDALRATAKEAAAAQKKAAEIYQSQKMDSERCGALKAAASSLLLAGEYQEAAATAKELKELPSPPEAKGVGLELVSRALQASSSATEGGAQEMVASAREAMTVFQGCDSEEGCASSAQALAGALLASEGDLAEAYKAAKDSAKRYKALNKSEDACASLLIAARVAMKGRNTTSAFWDAKQVVSESGPGAGYNEAVSIVSQCMRLSDEMEKPIGVGGPVPLGSGDAMAFI
mmetsp:Transcript_58217/g.170233  ORF Transcript_58217/g.170233 Transcript_58217/m.170233 type:complete len:670 (-) Transcript_58217:212-2221(-)